VVGVSKMAIRVIVAASMRVQLSSGEASSSKYHRWAAPPTGAGPPGAGPEGTPHASGTRIIDMPG
jgi:hypothetical protein